MGRTLVRRSDHDRNKSLGWLAVAWIEHFVVHGPGAITGEPVRHGDEYTGFIVDCYAVGSERRNNHLLYDSAFLSRPKGCDKSGLAARLALFEALGPCRFAGWAKGGETYEDPWGLGFTYVYEPGEPMGAHIGAPLIRIMATEEGQPLALDTPVPTPTGWTTVGELGVGDMVLDQAGRPQVVARETRVMEGLDCYAVTFSDGERIVASGSHLWTLERRNGKGTKFETVTVSTEQLAKDYIRGGSHGGTTGKRYRVAAGVEWQLPEADLPVDPYLLGLWLGDGKTRDAGIAFDYQLRSEYEEILRPLLEPHEEMVFSQEKGNSGVVRIRRRKGFCPWGHTYGEDVVHGSCGPCRRGEDRGGRSESLRERLRSIGVLGNKHIPKDYLRASADQRHALLQGLIDSDGTLTKSGKSVRAEFTNVNRQLIDDIEELLTSLGYKWSERYDKSVNAWRVRFVPCASKPVARLQYKVDRHVVLGVNARSRRRTIDRVERVDSVPVKCIGIDTDDHLFLVGRRAVPTHNTGNTYDSIHYNLTDDMAPLSEVPGVDAGLGGIKLPGRGEIMPSTSGSASKDGGKETFVVFDETHLYNTRELRQMYDTVTRNLRKRKKTDGSWYIETTTMFAAGEDSVAESTYRLAEALAEGKARRERQLYDHRWGECKNLADEKALFAALVEAYGDAGEWQDFDSLVDEFYDPRKSPEDCRRYFLNTRGAANTGWLSPHDWEACARPERTLDPGDTITLGFDGSIRDDATALVACRVSDGHLHLLGLWEKPEGPAGDGWSVDTADVDRVVAAAFERYNVIGMFADPAHWQDYVTNWTAEYGDQVRVRASRDRPLSWWTNKHVAMVNATSRLYEAIRSESVSYNPDDVALTRHALNAHRRILGRSGVGIAKEYAGSPRKIDAIMAAILAYECRAAAIADGVDTGPVEMAGYTF